MQLSVRELRLASGLVMLSYISLHLFNHMLGIVSLPLAEHGLRWAIWLWGSVPGTIALYGAFALHLALALRTIYLRAHWRLPPSEWLRLWSGFSLPLLLVGHAVATRLTSSLYGIVPSYENTIAGLIASGSQGWQIALLAPGWLHGCMGLWISLRRRSAFRHRRRWLIALMVLLPMLSAVGFLRMSQSVESRPVRLVPDAALTASDAATLAVWQHVLLAGYVLLLAGAFAGNRWRDARGLSSEQ